jgi:selenocysteine-specific elongation factor
MLAGVGGIDLVLLVVAADEGVKPQTREHFDICRLLSIPHGITVLTKADLVDPDTLQVVCLEVQELLKGSFLQDAPIIPVSSIKQSGLDELKRKLVQLAASTPVRDSTAITRLPIDRVFTMKGFGTVVTGTLVSGSIRKEDELELFPKAQRVRARGVQVHGTATGRAVAGERTALNLSGVNKEDVARGMMLATPLMLQSSSRLDVKLSLLSSSKPLKTGARVHLHAFTSDVIVALKLHEGKQVSAGAEAFAQIQGSAALLLVPGDRFIIRQFSPAVTIGGGIVLDAHPFRKMNNAARIEFLNVVSGKDSTRASLARITRRSANGITVRELTRESGFGPGVLEPIIASLLQQQVIVRHGDFLLSRTTLENICKQLIDLVTQFHAKNPLVQGISKESLREQARLAESPFEVALNHAVAGNKLALTADLVHLPGRGVVMKDEEANSRKIIESAFSSAGLKVPALKDVLAGLKIDKARAQKIVTLLLREKVLIKLSDDLVFHASALAQLRTQIHAEKARSSRIDVARFKDLTGVSRKYAIPLLEFLDRERVTKRDGDERIIL